jgi:signal transduction histidine kinase
MSKAGSREQLPQVVDRLHAQVAQLRASRRRVAEAAYADRRAIERALHDGVQQYLVALAIDLRHLAGLVDGDRAAATALIDEIAARAREALDQTTELAQSVYPPLLEGRGFASTLRYAAESAGVTAVVDGSLVGDYPPEIIAAIYWCWVEVLSSASRGSRATVEVRDENGALTFAFTVIGHPPVAGLDRLRDRVEALDGQLSIDERTDGGLRVHGGLPLSR